ncbi:hypothetical protein RclHR1_06340002 [Rhizophagus clarus]|uniref:Uncharacterized protein n=1 Tax=Rhizophagus clarus TaxID=94130 RepID=A0A2Z6RRT9_9GLOM|nr:hypothetical protein RclHR1_06340002 [Rhizophagus clarus]GES92185.1 hypothetical protein GLOIN_2v1520614 [Rhizophagus clarus]
MNKLFFLIQVFLFLITISAALPADDKLANIFYERNNCQCATAFADFDSSPSSGPFRGFVAFGQDENGSTTIFGAFNRGFNPNCTSEFLIVDSHGHVKYNVTRGLDVHITSDGGTEAFSHRFSNINLNCHSNGILLGGHSARSGNRGYSGGSRFSASSGDHQATRPIQKT